MFKYFKLKYYLLRDAGGLGLEHFWFVITSHCWMLGISNRMSTIFVLDKMLFIMSAEINDHI